jgi:hypothetical protein
MQKEVMEHELTKGLERVDNKASILPRKNHDHRVLSILQANISGPQAIILTEQSGSHFTVASPKLSEV